MAVIWKPRKSFGKNLLNQKTELPDLVEIQYKSYNDFLQADAAPASRKDVGLQRAFKSMFPMKNNDGSVELEFVDYRIEKPVYNVRECMMRNMTYASKLRLRLKLILWDIAEDGKKSLRDIKEQEIFMGEVPLMTERGTFIAAGVERVIVSQLQRAQGVIFTLTKESRGSDVENAYAAKIIPERGSWIDMEESKGQIFVRIDTRRKIHATTLLRCMPTAGDEKKWEKNPRDISVRGMTDAEILGTFYNKIQLSFDGKFFGGQTQSYANLGQFRLNHDLLGTKDKKAFATAGTRLNAKKSEKLVAANKEFLIAAENLIGEFICDAIMDGDAVLFDAGTEITAEVLADLEKLNIKNISILAIDNAFYNPQIRNTLVADKLKTREEALIEIYNVLRPGERPTVETAANLVAQQGFDSRWYDLTAVGRFKLNKRLRIDSGKRPEDERTLTKTDILAVLKTLMNIIDRKDVVDDIDNLSNRRVRSVGELLEQQFRIGLSRIERLTRDQLNNQDIASKQPQDLINAKPLNALVAEFLGTSQLSQFMESYNPLAEIEHKRLISALGPGGLNRERAGFEVRDVHPTHYGRLCPINSPEGPNIGLITHLANYARVNPYGFIETPYYVVKNGKVQDEILYLTADEEISHKIAQANTKLTNGGAIETELVTARVAGEFEMIPREEIDLIDVAPKQIISVATGLIPFIENDDGQRALMGSNMQRQGVPLLRSEAPLVGTGIEREVARDSRTCRIAKRSGIVESVDANTIVIKCVNSRGVISGVDIYELEKFQGSNSETIVHQKPLVKVGDRVSKDDIIADGSSTHYGELAIGKNVVVAFMPWRGYNYEDSIVISERISRDDVFTSIKIVEKEFKVHDTQLGPESLTRDIPNVGEEALRNLDESGIIYVGAAVKPGDILVGRVSPKSETMLTPEEALLRNIFGEKALSVKDTSLKCGPNEEGVVIGVNVLTRHGVKKDERTQMIELQKIEFIARNRDEKISIIEGGFGEQIFQIAEGCTIENGTGSIKPFIGKKLNREIFESIKPSDIKKLVVKDKAIQEQIKSLAEAHVAEIKDIEAVANTDIEKVKESNSLSAGVLKEVKIYIAHKTKLQPGDKMAGRHGNKGIVSRVVPIEDMPHLEDGTPVDIVLNPLGVPSRMNVGQILETHLGAAAYHLGLQIGEVLDSIKNKTAVTDDLRALIGKIYGKEMADKLEKMTDTDVRGLGKLLSSGILTATPSFDGATADEIHKMLKLAKLPETGQFTMVDGITGEKFDRPVTVGVMYMLKLHHLVDDKMHARSSGGYSLVTQQPLAGKAHGGGQRLGEMEVWALEAHGAAHLLKEMLTVKSDDIAGRNKMFEAVIEGNTDFQTGTPEAFNVLVRELKGLGLAMTPKKI
ncbi:MAG: DNA-directed RNA polymerase subunit beta [Rickettsiales bacterium]|jgi:DNA-directed RNA polymerase subunit beta|nr:DNA-directed RNA polymerase subunit beta [Rickettsiales bacterium]